MEALRAGGRLYSLRRRPAWVPASMQHRVVLPAPLCPRRTVICPWYRFRVRSLTALWLSLPVSYTCGRVSV